MQPNGFVLNQESRQHINLSKYAMAIIERDMIRFNNDFELSNKSGFMNQIITNFHSHFPLAPNLLLKPIYDLKNINDMKVSLVDLDHLIEKSAEAIMKEHIILNREKYQNDVKFKLKINKENVELFKNFDEATYFNEYAPRGAGLAFYIKMILESYADLRKEDREHIYFLETFELVELAMKNQFYVNLHWNGNKIKGKVKKVYCDKLTFTNLIEIEERISDSHYRTHKLFIKDLASSKLKVLKEKYVDFLMDEESDFTKEEEIDCKARFDAIGLVYFKNQENTLDIIGIPSKEDEHNFTFKASEQKLFANLFRFGPMLKIIEPSYLANRFKEIYQASANQYDEFEEKTLSKESL